LKPVRIAILDMYNNTPNEGMRGIKHIVEDQIFPNEWKVFDVCGKNELPDLDYDIYISSGGPGTPKADDEEWDRNWIRLMNQLWEHNKTGSDKKYVFFICHSFQMLVHHWKLAEVSKRISTAFGIFPIHKTAAGEKEQLLAELPEPFYAVDSRKWQVIKPDKESLKRLGAKILCIEKDRPHVPYERAVMGIRFSDEFVGFQFHPEADEFHMALYFQRDDIKKQIIEAHGEKKFMEMIEYLKDPGKIRLTYNSILPRFLQQSCMKLRDYTLP